MNSDEATVERVARAIHECSGYCWPWVKSNGEVRDMHRDMARAALAAMPAAPTLPAEPPDGCVRVRVGVWIYDASPGGYSVDTLPDHWRDCEPDAVLVADVRPNTPPEVAAVVEPGQ